MWPQWGEAFAPVKSAFHIPPHQTQESQADMSGRHVRQTCQDINITLDYIVDSTLCIGFFIPFVLPLRNICQYFANDDKNPIRLLLSKVSPGLGQLLCFFLLNLDRISVGFLLKTVPGYSWGVSMCQISEDIFIPRIFLIFRQYSIFRIFDFLCGFYWDPTKISKARQFNFIQIYCVENRAADPITRWDI